jgi:hypothetical protein
VPPQRQIHVERDRGSYVTAEEDDFRALCFELIALSLGSVEQHVYPLVLLPQLLVFFDGFFPSLLVCSTM